jgi:signal transduction histidine kinase
MDFFACNEVVQQLQAELPPGLTSVIPADPASSQRLLLLAWQLRQRDCEQALSLAARVEQALCGPTLPEVAHAAMRARVQLIRAEIKWLNGELDAAGILAKAGLCGFIDLADPLGQADAHWILAWIAYDLGFGDLCNSSLTTMANRAADLDETRVTIAQATLARFAVFRSFDDARQLWFAHFARDSSKLHPAAQSLVHEFHGTTAKAQSDFAAGVKHLSLAHGHAMATGQIRRAITIAINIGDAFNNLNDHHTALEWLQGALELARSKGWPANLGLALTQTAETLRHLRRFDSAHELLREALALMAPLAESRSYALALYYLGETELARALPALALDTFRLLEARAVALDQRDLQYIALRGQAQALLELGLALEAQAAAKAALAGARDVAEDRIAALRTLAAIHARHPHLPAPPHAQASAALHYLHQATLLAANIENYSLPPDLPEALAQEYARLADYRSAWEWGKQAASAREKTQNREATNRAMALHVSHSAEKARLEALQQRKLQEAQQQMMLQEKMASLGTLMAGIAHEINNPTNFLHVATQNLRLDLQKFQHELGQLVHEDEAPEVLALFTQRFADFNAHLATVLDGTERIKDIVKDLRLFTRLDDGEKQAVKLSSCLNSTLNLVRTNWLEQVDFMSDYSFDPDIECWPALLNQVFMNLLVNSCQAIAAKQAQAGELPERGKLWLRLLRDGDNLVVEVEDNGIGIAESTRARIMEPFFTTKEVGSGTGLGLSIAFGIVQKHGGTLNFSSTPGLGSCFRIELPLS